MGGCFGKIADWLDPLLCPFLAAAIVVTDVKDCVIGVLLEAYNCNDLAVACFRIESNEDLVAAAQSPFALGNAIEAPHLILSICVEEMLTLPAVAADRDPLADEIVRCDTSWSRRGYRCKQNDRCDNNCHRSNQIYMESWDLTIVDPHLQAVKIAPRE